MLRVPLPGVPGAGKCEWSYLNSPDSMACRASVAACAAFELILYLSNAALMNGTASSAVLHSAGNGALAQEAEFGMMALMMEASIFPELLAETGVGLGAAGAGAADEAAWGDATGTTGAAADELAGALEIGVLEEATRDDAGGDDAEGAARDDDATGDSGAAVGDGAIEEGTAGAEGPAGALVPDGYSVITIVVVIYKIPLLTCPPGGGR